MNPLLTIRDWFLSLPDTCKTDLSFFISEMHYEKNIFMAAEIDDVKSAIISFLSEESSSILQTVSKAACMTAIIDLALEGRRTEKDWQDSHDMNLRMKEIFEQNGRSTENIDRMLQTWSERSQIWISVCSEWDNIKKNHLTTERLTYYWMTDHKI